VLSRKRGRIVHGQFRSHPLGKLRSKGLVGTWTVVSVVAERDGRKFDSYGPNAKGMLVFDANGRYSIIFIAGGLPSFGSGIRSSVTADEAMTVVAGSLAHFGTYVVDEADKSITLQVDRATFPNWDGKEKSALLLSGVMSCCSWNSTLRPAGRQRRSSSAQSLCLRSVSQTIAQQCFAVCTSLTN
jgi:hypothetical protein